MITIKELIHTYPILTHFLILESFLIQFECTNNPLVHSHFSKHITNYNSFKIKEREDSRLGIDQKIPVT